MKQPNGYGNVTKMSGNRRRPWRVRVTAGYTINDETRKAHQRFINVGYYATRKEAMEALAEYRKTPYSIDYVNITFGECMDLWLKSHIKNLGEGRRNSVQSEAKRCAPLRNIKMTELRLAPIESFLADLPSDNLRSKCKIIISSTFDYAIRNDIVQKNYGKLAVFTHTDKDKAAIHSAFTFEEIKLLWDNQADPTARLALIGIYTGMRPSEMLTLKKENIDAAGRFLTGGMKTKAGKNRLIPVHKDILPLLPTLLNTPTYNSYRERFTELCEALNIHHLPHDTRHTFATISKLAGIRDDLRKKILGHAMQDITDGVYTHGYKEELLSAIDMIDIDALSKVYKNVSTVAK